MSIAMSGKVLDPRTAEQICRNGGRVVMEDSHSRIEYFIKNNLVCHGYCEGGIKCSSFNWHGKYEHPDYPADVWGREYPCELPGPEAKALIMKAPAGMLEGANANDKNGDRFYEWWDGEKFIDHPDYKMGGKLLWGEGVKYTVRIRESWAKRGHEARMITPPKTSISTEKTRALRDESLRAIAAATSLPHPYIPGEVVKTEAEARAAMAQGWMLDDGDDLVHVAGVDDIMFLCRGGGGWIQLGHISLLVQGDVFTVTTPDPELFTPGMTVPAALAEKLCMAGWVLEVDGRDAVYFRHTDAIRLTNRDMTGPWCNGIAESFVRDKKLKLLRYEPWRVPSDEYRWSGEEAAAALRAGMEAQPTGVSNGWLRQEGEDLCGWTDSDSFKCQFIDVRTQERKFRLRWLEQQEEEKVETQTETMTKAAKLKAIQAIVNGQFNDSIGRRQRIRAILNTPEPDTLTAGEALDWAIQKRGDSEVLCARDGSRFTNYSIRNLSTWRLGELAPFTLAPPKPEYEVVEMHGLELRCYANWVECDGYARSRSEVDAALEAIRTANESGIITEGYKVGCTVFTALDLQAILAAMDKTKEGQG